MHTLRDPRALIGVVIPDAAVRDAIGVLLEAAGFLVAEFESAAQFLAAPTRSRLAGVIVEEAMPMVGGIELLLTLRLNGDRIPCAVLTDQPSPDLLRRIGHLAQVITKPFVHEPLLCFVRAING